MSHDMHEHMHEHGGLPAARSTLGLHGMVLFGTEVLYLSHLPMFAGPHNFQVILEVTLDDAATGTLRADRGAPDLHTFKPELFAITELDSDDGGPARTSISGTIHHGHFERGGPELTAATATVREVVHFAELDVDGTHDDSHALSYLCFGRVGQLHLVHEITANPDFDQILSVDLVPGSVRDPAGRPVGQDVTEEFRTAVPVQFAGRTDTPTSRLRAQETAAGFFLQSIGPTGSHGFGVDVAVGREWYRELRELGS